MNIMAPRGTNDLLPPLSLHWQYVENIARQVFANYNYQEIRTPIFEYTELFQRGIGEVTDIVEKEMYTFTDKSGRSITLRPENTASVVRSFLENKIYGQPQPNKYFYLGPMFRYERPQAGRFRQFYQLGIEALGSNDPAIDAEVINLGLNLLKELGLTGLEVYINSIGCPECRAEYIKVLQEYLMSRKGELCSDCQNRLNKNPLRVLDCKDKSCAGLLQTAPKIIDYLCIDCQDHFEKVKEYLTVVKVDFIVEPMLVRGLDYYTHTAFEIKYNKLGAQDTIFAGGRYNGLAEEIGGRSIPGVGFALGLERLMLTIAEQGISLPVEEGIDLFIASIGEDAKKAAFTYVHSLRDAGFRAEIDYLARSVKSQLKTADRFKARFTIVLGEDELKKGTARIKNMETGEQAEICLTELVEKMAEKAEKRG